MFDDLSQALMRVLILTPEFSGSGGGIATFYRAFTPELCELGVDVRVIEGSGVHAEADSGAHVHSGVRVEMLEHSRLLSWEKHFFAFEATPGLRRNLAAAWAMWGRRTTAIAPISSRRQIGGFCSCRRPWKRPARWSYNATAASVRSPTTIPSPAKRPRTCSCALSRRPRCRSRLPFRPAVAPTPLSGVLRPAGTWRQYIQLGFHRACRRTPR